MTDIRVNIRTAINASAIQIERKPKHRNGDDYTIIKNHKWMIDGIVLNSGLYSKEENEKGYKSMEGRLFTAGHPASDKKHVLISDQSNPDSNAALASHYIGASTINVRKDGDAYYEDIEINNRVAGAHKDGVELLDWCSKVEKGEQVNTIHTSTGLLCSRVNMAGKSRNKDFTWIATNQKYDHNALLVGQVGAGGDEIALAVNEDGEELESMTVNLDEFNEVDDSNEPKWFKRLVDMITIKQTSNEKVDPMKEKMIAALKKGGVETEGLSDDQLFAEYNKMISAPKKKEPDVNIEQIVSDAVTKALNAKEEADAKAKKQSLVDEVIKTNKAYTEDHKEELLNTSETILNTLVIKKAAAIRAPGGEAKEHQPTSVANMAMPE